MTKELAPLTIDVGRLTHASAIELCQKKPEIAGQLIIALATQNTAMLPGTAFVRRSDGTFLYKQRVNLTLRESQGDLNKMNNRWDMTLQGVRRCNEVASINVIRPESVIVDGKKQMNPYIHVDEKTKVADVVYARCIALGYSPNGSLVATDTMVRLDVGLYFIENIQSKMKGLGQHAESLGIYGSGDIRPVDHEGNEVGWEWVFLPIHSVGNLGLWVNTQHLEMRKVFADHTTRLKYVERLAQSFAERNALKSHPSIPSRVEAVDGVASVPIYGWTTDFSREEMDKLRTLVEQDRLHEYKDARGQEVTVSSVEEEIDPDDGDADEIIAAEQGADGKRSDDEPEDEPKRVRSVDMLQKSIECYQQLMEVVGSQRLGELMGELGIEHIEEASQEQQVSFIQRAEQLLDGVF